MSGGLLESNELDAEPAASEMYPPASSSQAVWLRYSPRMDTPSALTHAQHHWRYNDRLLSTLWPGLNRSAQLCYELAA